MPFVLYLGTAAALLWLARRFVRPLSFAAAIVLVAIPLGITGYALVSGGVYGPVDYLYQDPPLKGLAAEHRIPAVAKNASAVDIVSEFFPWRRAVQLSLARGEWPLWNPYNLCGHPLAAEAQSAPYSPFTLLACLLPAAQSLSYSAAIGLFLAALSAFLFARELGCGEAASLVAGIGWGLASCNVLYILTAMGFTTVFAPLLLLATRRVVRTPGLASGALLTTTLALTILSGHPESLFLNVLVGCLYGAFELLRNRATAIRGLLTAIAAGLAAAALCAIFLLPLLEAIPQSTEYHVKNKAMGEASQRVSNAEFLATLATSFYPHLHVRSWRTPPLGAIAAETAAVGSLVLALAVYAVWRKRSAETWLFGALALLFLVAGARWEGIADLAVKVPLLDITLLQRFSFHAALLLVMLAAIGVDDLLQRDSRRSAALTIFAVTLLLGGGMLWMRGHIALHVTPADYGRYRVFAELFFPAAAALLLAVRVPLRVVAPLLLALVFGQRALSEVDTFETYPARAAYPPVALFAPLQDIREPFRIVGRATAFPPATNTFYDLEDVRGYEALTLDQFQRTWMLWSRPHGIWYNRVDELAVPFLSFMNVRFAIQDAAEPVPDGWREVAKDRGSLLLENTRVLPRIFVPRRVEISGATAEEVADRMHPARDFGDLAWITAPESSGIRDNGPGTVVLRSRRLGGEYRFDATMERDGFVVISDSAWIGWRAYIDGRRVGMHRANAAFLGIFVPAGKHDVRVVYWPASFVRGRAITFATLALAALLVLWRWRLRRRKQRRPALA